MLKLIIGFERRPGMSREDCHNHLERAHADLVQKTTEFSRYLTGYVQNFGTEKPNQRGTFEFETDGVAELWFESLQAAGKAFSEPRYLALVRPDEMRFADLSRLICAGTEEELLWDDGGNGSRKLIRFISVHPEGDLKAAATFWRGSYPALIAQKYRGNTSVYRYVQNWPSADSQSIFPSILPLLCIEEFWLSNDMTKADRDMFELDLMLQHDHLPGAVNIGGSVLFAGRERQVVIPPVIEKA